MSSLARPQGPVQCPILVVEDEALIRMILVDQLEDAGFEVIEAESADAAMMELTRYPDIGAVVTDVRMPGSIDGLGLAAWMREHRSAVPIIITSGFSTPPDTDAINPAIVKIVAKPYKPQEVASWLEEILQLGDRRALGHA